jgi:hypothetical protein
MTPAPDDRDPVVAEALDRLAPPDPSPAFWSTLDDELRQTTPSTRSWRLGWPALTAAAVVVVAALAAVALADRGDDQAPVAAPTSTTSTPTTSTTSTTNTTVVTPPGEPASAADAVLAWVDALRAEDAARALELLAPRSAQWITERGGIDFSAGTAGLGPLISHDRTTQTTRIVGSGEGSVEVVVVTGTGVTESGSRVQSLAFPVRYLGGRYLVEPYDWSAQIGIHSPVSSVERWEVDRDEVIRIWRTGSGTLSLRLDDTEPILLTPDSDGEFRFAPAAGFSPGEHVLLAVSVGPDHVTAAVTRFFVP